MDWTALWLIWIGMFAAIEGAAIATRAPGATLTSHIAKWASLKGKANGWLARRASLAAFFGWLVYHFVKRTDW